MFPVKFQILEIPAKQGQPQRHEVQPGQVLRIKALSQVRYQLEDVQSQQLPKGLKWRRLEQDLWLSLDDSEVVLASYYDLPDLAASPVGGLTPDQVFEALPELMGAEPSAGLLVTQVGSAVGMPALQSVAALLGGVAAAGAAGAAGDSASADLSAAQQLKVIADAAQANTAGSTNVSLLVLQKAGVTGVTEASLAWLRDVLNSAQVTAESVATLAQLQALVDAIRVVQGYAGAPGQAVPTVAQLQLVLAGATDAAGHLLRVSDDNLAATLQQWAQANAQSPVSSLANYSQRVSDALAGYRAALDALGNAAHANDAGATLVAVTVYQAAGVRGVNDGNLRAINRVLDSAAVDRDQVSTAAQVQALVDGYNTALADALQVVQSYTGASGQQAPTAAQFNVVLGSEPGIDSGAVVEADSLAAVQAALAAANATAGTRPVTWAQVVSDALAGYRAALDALGNAAHANDAGGTPVALGVYQAAGVRGVNDGNVRAIDSVLDSAAVGRDQVSSTAQVQALVDGYNKVLAAADGTDGNAAALPSLADHAALGLTLNTANAVLLSDVIDGKVHADVDTVAKLQALADGVKLAQGYTGAGGTTAPTAAQLNALVSGLHDSLNRPLVVTADNIDAVRQALAALNAQTGLRSQAELVQLVASASQTSEDKRLALDAIMSAAQANTASSLDAALYSTAGIKGVTGDNVAAINSALNTSAVTGQSVNTVPQLQALVDSYNKVLAAADGVDGNAAAGALPVQADYNVLGMDVGSAAQAGLLSDVVDGQVRSGVNTVTGLLAILDGVKAVQSYTGESGQIAPSAAQLNLVVWGTADAQGQASAVNAGNVQAVLGALATANRNGTVSTQALLRSLVTDATQSHDMPDPIDPTQQALAVIQAAAQNNSASSLGTQDYAAAGVSGVMAEHLPLLASVLDSTAISGASVASRDQLQVLVDVVGKVLIAADGQTGNTTSDGAITEGDCAVLGLVGVSEAGAAVLSSVLDGLSTGDVDTVGKLQVLADAVMVVQSYTGASGQTAPSAAQLNVVGHTAVVTADNLAAVQAALAAANQAAITDVNSHTAAGSQAELAQIVSDALVSYQDAIDTLSDAAHANDALATHVPATVYRAAGVQGVTDSNLASIGSVLDSAVVDRARVNTATKVQAMVDAYNKVLAAADGTDANTASGAAPTQADYAALGLTLTSANATLLGDVVDGKALNDVVTFDKLQALADAVVAVQGYTGALGTNAVAAPTLEQLQALVSDLRDSHGNPLVLDADNLPAAWHALASLNVQAGLYTQAELVAGVAQAIEAEQQALERIQLAAEANTANTLDAGVYIDAGVQGVTSANVAAINSALNTVTIDGMSVGTEHQLQALVDRYNLVLAAADGTNANSTNLPILADYTALGLTGVDSAAQAHLLSNVVDSKTTADVNTVPKLQALADAVVAVQGYTGVSGQVVPTVAQLNALATGLHDAQGHALVVDADNLSAVLDALAAANASSPVGTQAALTTLVTQAIVAEQQALSIIQNAAQNNTAGSLGVADFGAAGVHGVSPESLPLLASVLDSAAVNAALINTERKVQALVDAVYKVLAAADGQAGNMAVTNAAAAMTPADCAALGLPTVSDAGAALFSAVLDGKTASDVNTADKLQALLAAVNAVQGYSGAQGQTAPTAAQLNAVMEGVPDASGHPLVVNADSLAAVQAALAAANSAQSGQSAVTSPAALVQMLSDALTSYQAALDTLGNAAHANDATLTHVPASVYAAAGVRGVTDANHEALESVLDSAAVDRNQVDSALKVQSLVDSYNKVLAASDGIDGNTATSAMPTRADYTALGVTGVASDAQATLLSDVLDGKTNTDVNTVPKLQALADAVRVVQGYTAGTTQAVPTAEQLNALVSGLHDAQGHALVVDDDSLSAVLHALALFNGQTPVATQDALAVLVAQALEAEHAAMDRIQAAAQSNDTTGIDATVYVDAGVVGVSAANVGAINSALQTAAVNGAAVDTEHKVQALVDSYSKVLAAADGADGNTTSTAQPTQADYARLGVTGVGSTATTAWLNDVVDGKTTTDVNTVSKLQALANAVVAVQNYHEADSRQVTAPTAAQINALVAGQQVQGVAVPTVGTDTLALVQAAINAANSDGTPLLTQQDLAEVVNTTLTSYHTAIEALMAAAVNDTPVSADVYADAGITGVSSANLTGLNSVLMSFTPNTNVVPIDAEVQALVQRMVSSYNTIANTPASATSDDYANLGVPVDSGSATALMDSVVSQMPLANRDSANELHGLADAVAAVLRNVADASAPVSDTELAALGVQGVRPDNLAAVQAALAASADDGSAVSSLAQLQALVDAINDAPVLAPSHLLTLGVVAEDSVPVPTAGTQGVLVNQAVIGVSDADDGNAGSSALKGIAIVGVNGGTLYVSQDDGQSWSAVSNASNTHALLLKADGHTQVVFRPDANYNGTLANAITFRAWDQSAGTAGSYADASVNGGISAFSAATDTVAITVTSVNDAPVLSGTIYTPADPDVAAYLEGDLASDPLLPDDFAIADGDDTNLTQATLTITDQLADGSDVLRFVDTANISGSFDAATGVLTLTALHGTASVADFKAAIASVRYESLSFNPTNVWTSSDVPRNTRTIRLSVTDDGSGTGADERTSAPMDLTLVVSADDNAPVVTLNTNAKVVKNGSLTQVDPNLNISDADDTQLFGAFVRVANWNYAQDVLALDLQDAQGQIVSTVVDVRGAADQAAALAAVQTALNGKLSHGGTVVTGITYVAQGESNSSDFASVQSALIDTNDVAIQGFLQITWGYQLVVESGNAAFKTPVLHSMDDYEAVLRSLQIGSTEANSQRPVEFTVSDARKGATGFARVSNTTTLADVISQFTGSGSASSRDVLIDFGGNNAPVIALGSTPLSWTEGSDALVLDKIASITDLDGGGNVDHIRHATVVLSNALVTDELVVDTNGLSALNISAEGPAVYDASAHTWTLAFSGLDTQANYQALLNQIEFRNTSADPSAGGTRTSRTVTVTLADDFANGTAQNAQTGTAQFNIAIDAVNDAPQLVGHNPSAHATEQTDFALRGAFTLSDADVTASTVMTATFGVGDATQEGLTVTVGNSGVTLESGGTGGSSAVVTGTLAQLQALLAGTGTALLSYRNLADYTVVPGHVSLVVSDAGATGAGDVQTSLTATVSITIDPVNDAPVLHTTTGAAAYTEGGVSAVLNAGLELSDVDGLTLSSAKVWISQGLTAGDVLTWTSAYGVSGNYDAATGTLSLSGVASLAHYQEVLRGVGFRSTSDNPTATSATRTLSWQVDDGGSSSLSQVGTSTLNITAVNNPAVIGGDVQASLTETDAVQTVGGVLTITDPDSPATFVAQASTAGSHGFGHFALNAQGAWSYSMETAHNEFAAGHVYTDSFTVSAADGTQQVVTVRITGTDDMPVVQVTTPQTHAVEQTAFSLAGVFAISDVDSSADLSAVLSTSDGQPLTAQVGTTGVEVVDGGDGIRNYVVVQGTLAQLQAWLAGQNGASLSYTFAGDNPTEPATLTLQINDGEGGVSSQSVSLFVDGVNDPAVIGGVTSASLTETNVVQTASGVLTLTDPDSPEVFVAQTNTRGSNGYGSFSLSAAGHWVYTMDTAHNEFVAGQLYTDSFTVASADGVQQQVTVSMIGRNDAPVLDISGRAVNIDLNVEAFWGGGEQANTVYFNTSSDTSIDFSSGAATSGKAQIEFVFSMSDFDYGVVMGTDHSAPAILRMYVSANGVDTLYATITGSPIGYANGEGQFSISYANGATGTLNGTHATHGSIYNIWNSSQTTTDQNDVATTWYTLLIDLPGDVADSGAIKFEYNTQGDDGAGPNVADDTVWVKGVRVYNGTALPKIDPSDIVWNASDDVSLGTSGPAGAVVLSYTDPVTQQLVNVNMVELDGSNGVGWVLPVGTSVPEGVALTAVVTESYSGHELYWCEGQPPAQVVTANMTINDLDEGSLLQGASIRLVNRFEGDQLTVNGAVLADGDSGTVQGLSYSASVTAGGVTLTLAGVGSAADYTHAMQQVGYVSTSQNPNGSDRRVEITVNDGLNNSNTAISTIAVFAINDQPTSLLASVSLASVFEDASVVTGNTVANLFGAAFGDVDTGQTLAGVVVTANAATASQGAWQWNNAGTWTNLGAGLSDSHAQWFSATTQLRFVPAANFNGTPGGLTVRLADSTVRSMSNGRVVNISSADPAGWSWDGPTDALSHSTVVLTTSVTPVNNAPVLANTVLALTSVNQNASLGTGSTGDLVSTLVGGISDADGATVPKGIAITGVNANGVLLCTLDGGQSWTVLSSVSASNAYLLGAGPGHRVFFNPNPGFTGSLNDAFTFRAWDGTTGTDGAYASTTVNGGSTAFSAATDTVSLQVLDVTPPTATLLTSGSVMNNASVSVRSTEAGIAYLVRSTVSVQSVNSITSAADSDWNSMFLTNANTATNLSLAGLTPGSYVLYTVDGSGNLSAASTASVTVTQDPTVNLTSLTPAMGMLLSGVGAGSIAGTGFSVSSAGDVNGDGLDDVIVGAPGVVVVGQQTGRSFVVFGRTNAQASLNLSSLVAGTSTDGFVINGQTGMGEQAGYSVSAAGDVNGDGLADLLVGAPNSVVNGVLNYGRSYVVYGRTGAAAVSLNTLSGTATSDGFAMLGVTNTDRAGYVVSAAGDVNGDGLADMLVGTDNNKAYVVYGSTAGVSFNLSALEAATPTGGFVIRGVANTQLGRSVSDAGDVNGDGLADVIVGAAGFGTDTGRAYVLFGSTSAPAAVNLSAAVPGFQIAGGSASDLAGFSVSGIGDVNGDGLADVVVGAKTADVSSLNNEGRSYVVFGKANNLTVNLTAVAAGSGGFVINGEGFANESGSCVSEAGDLNGDGLMDLLVSSTLAAANGASASGRVYVVYGKLDGAAVNLSAVAVGSGGFVINGQAASQSGRSVSAAGDINGDGYADLIVGVDTANSGAGNAYVIYGRALNINTQLSGSAVGTSGDDVLGGVTGTPRLSGGDGNDTLVLAAFDTLALLNNTPGAPKAMVNGGGDFDTLRLTGGASLDLTAVRNAELGYSRISSIERIDLATDTGGNSLTLNVSDVADMAGMNLIHAGFSADGNSWASSIYTLGTTVRMHQVVVDGNSNDSVTLAAGLGGWYGVGTVVQTAGSTNTTYNVYQNDTVNAQVLVRSGVVVANNDRVAPAVQLSAVAAGTGGFVINGVASFDFSGYSVSNAGDVNGDGLDDVLVGAYSADPTGATDGGRAYVVFGKTNAAAVDLSAVVAGSGGFVINAQSGGDFAGYSVSTVGDVNGDGLADVIVGANNSDPSTGTNAGRSYVVYGKANTTAVNLSAVATGNGGFVINGQCANDNSGVSVSMAGDVNGDGLSDWVVGANFSDPATGIDAGRSYVVFGQTASAAINLSAVAAGSGGFVINGQSTSDFSGASVSSAGDVNGDGLADLIVGASSSDPSGGLNAGRSYVVFGHTATAPINLSAVAAGTGGFVINGQCANDSSGVSVSLVGDVNGDGLADLVVGANLSSPSAGTNAGRSYVVFGKTNTTAVDLSAVALGVGGFVINGQQASERSGNSVSMAGDLNGDGLMDLLVGAPFGSPAAGPGAGRTYVVYGKANTTAVDLTSVAAGVGGFVINGQCGSDNSGVSVRAAGDVNGDGYADLLVGAYGSSIYTGRSYVVYGGPQYVTGNVVLTTGTSANEWVVGTSGADTLVGNGGVDRFSAGMGDDTIVLQASDVSNLANNTVASLKAFVDGGTGFNTLRLSGGANLDLTTISNAGGMTDATGESLSRLNNIECIDLGTDAAANTLTLSARDVNDMAGMNLIRTGSVSADGNTWTNVSGAALSATTREHQLVVTGNAGDSLTLSSGLGGWYTAGKVTYSGASGNYFVYQNDTTHSQVIVSEAVTVTNNSPGLAQTLNLGTFGSLNLNLIAPVQFGGKTYYFLDQNQDGVVNTINTGSDVVNHNVLDFFLNGSATDTTANVATVLAGQDADRSVVINGYTIILPTTGETYALVNDPAILHSRWSGSQMWFWTATAQSAGNHSVQYAVGNSNTTNNVASYADTASFAVIFEVYVPTIAPVVLDLNHDGVFSYTHTLIDTTGTGQLAYSAWAGAQDGVLVWNKYGDGLVHDSSQYAFTQYGGNTDLAGLAAGFDTNHDGVLDAQDAKFGEFMVWQDANGDGVSQASEMHSLADVGVTSLSLTSDGVTRSNGDGVTEAGRTSATLSDGSSMSVADAAFDMQSGAVQGGNGVCALLGSSMQLDLDQLKAAVGEVRSVDLGTATTP